MEFLKDCEWDLTKGLKLKIDFISNMKSDGYYKSHVDYYNVQMKKLSELFKNEYDIDFKALDYNEVLGMRENLNIKFKNKKIKSISINRKYRETIMISFTDLNDNDRFLDKYIR